MPALVADVIPSSCVDGPGNRYVLFLQGCTFNCLACHNPQTIGRRPTPTTSWRTVDQLLADITAAAPFLSGVTVSGGEATCQWQVIDELFRVLRADPATASLSLLVDSNGDAEQSVWDALATCMDGAMVDLKALDVDTHRFLTGHDNARVLASLIHLDAIDKLTEVRLLLVPGVNDAPEQIDATAEWLLGLRSEPTVVLSGFRHDGTRPVARQFREATPADLAAAHDRILRSWGQHRRTPPITRGLPTRHERSASIPPTSIAPNEV